MDAFRIRICKESFIEEIETMYTSARKDYFTWVARHIETNPAFTTAYCDLDLADYERLIAILRRYGSLRDSYYHKTETILQELLQLKEAQIWTRKEVLEVKEALMVSYDQKMQELFLPWLNQTRIGHTFICLIG